MLLLSPPFYAICFSAKMHSSSAFFCLVYAKGFCCTVLKASFPKPLAFTAWWKGGGKKEGFWKKREEEKCWILWLRRKTPFWNGCCGGKRDVCYYDFLRRRRRRPLRRTMIICIHSRTIGIKIRRLDNTSPFPYYIWKKTLLNFEGKGVTHCTPAGLSFGGIRQEGEKGKYRMWSQSPLDDDKFRSLIVRRRLFSSSPV